MRATGSFFQHQRSAPVKTLSNGGWMSTKRKRAIPGKVDATWKASSKRLPGIRCYWSRELTAPSGCLNSNRTAHILYWLTRHLQRLRNSTGHVDDVPTG